MSGERVVERVLHAPVEFQNLPGGLEIIGNPPDTVEVRVRGSSGALSRISAGDISTVLDLRTARPGRRLLHLEPSQVSVPYGIDVVQVGPSTITMEFETSGVRKVSVEPSGWAAKRSSTGRLKRLARPRIVVCTESMSSPHDSLTWPLSQ